MVNRTPSGIDPIEQGREARLRRWAPYELATSIIQHPDQLTDAVRSAQANADVWGQPVRIIRRYDSTSDIIEPNERKLRAYGHWDLVPSWVRREMGWNE